MNDVSGYSRDMLKRLTTVLVSSLPCTKKYENEVIVVKYGGHAMGDPSLGQAFAQDIALLQRLGARPIVIHGGGPRISEILVKMGITPRFECGLRVTDEKVIEVVEMALVEIINKEIVALINSESEWGIGLCGKDGNMVFSEKIYKTIIDPSSHVEHVLDLGFVGKPVEIDRTLLDFLTDLGMIPVIASVSFGRDGKTYNINADTFAGAIAGAVGAKRLLFLTDVPGVLNKDGVLLERVTVSEAENLIKDSTISGGMIPKVETCIEALKNGVEGVVILNGKTPHAVFWELFSEQSAGTRIVS